MIAPDEAELEALEDDRAFVDLSSYRKFLVSGSDAGRWLHDLVTADVASLQEGEGRRSLLLSPTGRIRADVKIARVPEGYLLIQDDEQAAAIDGLLAPYVLSSDVAIHDLGPDHVLVAALGGAARRVGWPGTRPSVAGPGEDLLATRENAWKLESMMMKKQLVEVSKTTLEIWRIARGIPRLGPDFGEASLPAEAGLDDVIDLTKGCFLGQESVARVRNLGHPARVVLHLETDGEVSVGAQILSGASPVGEVSSAAPRLGDPGSVLLARVRWDVAEAPLSVFPDVPVRRIGSRG